MSYFDKDKILSTEKGKVVFETRLKGNHDRIYVNKRLLNALKPCAWKRVKVTIEVINQ